MEPRIIHCSLKAEEMAGELRKQLMKALSPYSCPPVFFAPLKAGQLGLYDSKGGCIFLSDSLLSHDKSLMLQIALHEAAHHKAFILTGSPGHDDAFRSAARSLGAMEDYAKARISIKEGRNVLEKIRKLKALSGSPFEAESEAALRKVRQLMVTYSLEDGPSDSVCMCDLYSSRTRIATHMRTLCQIVSRQTGVFLVRVSENGISSIRAYGSHEELEVAIYLFSVLHEAVERQLKILRKENPQLYRGVTGTNSFYDGVLSTLQERLSADASEHALMLIHNENERKAKEIVFHDRSLRKTSSCHRFNQKVYESGRTFAKTLNVRRPLETGRSKLLPS